MTVCKDKWSEISKLSDSPNFLDKGSKEYSICMRYLIDLLEARVRKDLPRSYSRRKYKGLNRLRNGIVHNPSRIKPKEIRRFLSKEAKNLLDDKPLTYNIDTYDVFKTSGAVGTPAAAAVNRYARFYKKNISTFGTRILHSQSGEIKLTDAQTRHSCYSDLMKYIKMLEADKYLTNIDTFDHARAKEYIIASICEVAEQVAYVADDKTLQKLGRDLKKHRNNIAHSSAFLKEHEIQNCLYAINNTKDYIIDQKHDWKKEIKFLSSELKRVQQGDVPSNDTTHSIQTYPTSSSHPEYLPQFKDLMPKPPQNGDEKKVVSSLSSIPSSTSSARPPTDVITKKVIPRKHKAELDEVSEVFDSFVNKRSNSSTSSSPSSSEVMTNFAIAINNTESSKKPVIPSYNTNNSKPTSRNNR